MKPSYFFALMCAIYLAPHMHWAVAIPVAFVFGVLAILMENHK